MKGRRGIRPGFVVLMTGIVLGVSMSYFVDETKALEPTVAVRAEIVDARREPRNRVLELKATEGALSGQRLVVTVPFWDDSGVGEEIVVRVNVADRAVLGVDNFLYLHKTSLGILAGASALALIVAATSARRGRATGRRHPGAGRGR